ncbi:hypothetical protein [Streptomyces anulatus]|uniref:hypothetical protein n=1 Tax=Streptomyces anulatus TaxID=1892 RepID=UPI00386BCA64|nr:hypothetical protein OG882_04880 [Streptomyces anulatus]
MTDTPMTPDQPTPVELTEQQLDALIDEGNRALNDHYHEAQCHCDDWPASCVSSGHYFMGAWDTDAFAIGVPAVLGVWETLRHDRVADLEAEVDRLRKALSDAADQVAELDDELGKASAHTHFLERNTLPDLHRQIERHKDGKARWRKRAETAEAKFAELTAAPVDEAVEMAEGEAELEVMRREHPAPCRVPDPPDCTCPSPERLLARDELKKMLRGHLFGGGTP